ncbi:unnamed protein product [Ilex paraguariensis]|uniref:DUF4408 domain-containing protein n=1 Tax=Ilex paraguariensis TaxID=185542 RepID=A0ABC8UQY9_9AQUA
MDPLRMKKIQAMKKYKKQQILCNLIVYSLTAFTCMLFCSSPFWHPPLRATMNVFLTISLPKMTSLFLGSKFLFILGNLIVIFLVQQSNIFNPDSSSGCDVCYDEYVNRTRTLRNHSPLDKKEERKLVESLENVQGTHEDLDGEELSLPAEELNKRVDDFIARINKQRRLEAVQQFGKVSG